METLSLNRVLKGPVYLVLYSSVMLYTCHLTFLQWLLTMWKRHLSGAGVWFVHLCHRRTTVDTFNSCQYIPPKSYTLELKVLFWGRLAESEDLLCAHLKVRWAGNIWASWEQENPSDVTSPAGQKNQHFTSWFCLRPKVVRSVCDMTADDCVTVSHTLRSVAHVCNIAFQSIRNQALILLFPY